MVADINVPALVSSVAVLVVSLGVTLVLSKIAQAIDRFKG